MSIVKNPIDEITAKDAREEFAALVNQVAYGKTRVRITRRGRALVGIVPIEDLKRLEELEDAADIRMARERANEPDIPLEEVGRRLGLAKARRTSPRKAAKRKS